MLDQPGTRWRYNTGATVAGVLIERVAGAPLAEVLRERVFEPLGMADTGFWVPAAKRDRLTTFYVTDDQAGVLSVLDRPDGWYSAPPALPDASGWLVSTADDLWAFASMLAADGGRLLSAESVRLMTLDRMTAAERTENQVFVGDHSGWGLMMLVPVELMRDFWAAAYAAAGYAATGALPMAGAGSRRACRPAGKLATFKAH